MNKEQTIKAVWEKYKCPGVTFRDSLEAAFDAGVEYAKKGTKPSIDRSHVQPDFKWLAQEPKGDAWLYTKEPTEDGYGWDENGGEICNAGGFASYQPGTCGWKDSYVERPEGV